MRRIPKLTLSLLCQINKRHSYSLENHHICGFCSFFVLVDISHGTSLLRKSWPKFSQKCSAPKWSDVLGKQMYPMNFYLQNVVFHLQFYYTGHTERSRGDGLIRSRLDSYMGH